MSGLHHSLFLYFLYNLLISVLNTYLGSPEKPQFEDVVVPAALNSLITRVIGNVIVLVLLE